MTGTGFTYTGSAILGGDYTSILVATDASFSTPIATYSSGTSHDAGFFFLNGSTDALPNADTIDGSSGADTINGRGGADTLDGKVGGDTYVFNASEIDAGLTVNDTGGSGTDTIRLGTGTDFDFTVAAAISGIEALTFANTPQTATFNSDQLPGNVTAAALAVTGANSSLQTLIVENATNFSAALWTFASWAATDLIKINGTSGANTIAGSILSDIIAGGGGADTLDGGNGSDHYTLVASDLVAGLTISDAGASGVDTLDFGSGDFDFTGCTVSGIENLNFTGFGGFDFRGSTGGSVIQKLSFGPSNNNLAGFDAEQVSATLVVELREFTAASIFITNATQFSAAKWTFIENDFAPAFVDITGTDANDTIAGSGGGDIIRGGLGADVVNGGLGNDTVSGAQGSDVIRGGAGKDDLTGGDAEADIFAFDRKTDSKKGVSHDVIHDFNGIQFGELDRISLSKIDAKAGVAGNQHFKFIGMNDFHHRAGELHYKFVDLNHDTVAETIIEGDINGDGRADFQIELTNVISLHKGDFIL